MQLEDGLFRRLQVKMETRVQSTRSKDGSFPLTLFPIFGKDCRLFAITRYQRDWSTNRSACTQAVSAQDNSSPFHSLVQISREHIREGVVNHYTTRVLTRRNENGSLSLSLSVSPGAALISISIIWSMKSAA